MTIVSTATINFSKHQIAVVAIINIIANKMKNSNHKIQDQC